MKLNIFGESQDPDFPGRQIEGKFIAPPVVPVEGLILMDTHENLCHGYKGILSNKI